MGGLYIEMAVLKVLGDWLINSGWTTADSKLILFLYHYKDNEY